MAGEVQVRVEPDGLTETVRRLRQTAQGKQLLKQLRKDTRRSLAPAVPAIRSAVKGLPSKGESARRGRPGLRKTTAKATRLQVKLTATKAGVTVRVDPRKMPQGMHNLPAYVEGTFKPWRVKEFGTDRVHEQHAHPYFDPIIRRYRPQAVRAIEEALDKVRGELEG